MNGNDRSICRKMNQMTSLIGEVRKSVDDYSSELFSLKLKAVNIRKSVCNLDDVIGMVQTSTQIQEQKAESLETFSQKTEEFTAEVVRIDEEAAAVGSTIGSSVLNIVDTWGNIDNPMFNACQSALNWTSMISNGLYSIGSIYNGIKGIENGALRKFGKSWREDSNFRNVIGGADNFQFSVQPDTSTFWAGLGKDGQYIAKDKAASLGRTTLESTIESQNIAEPVGNLAWDSASASYAMRSSGGVMTITNQDMLGKILPNGRMIGQTWLTVERVILNVNPHVTSIDGILRTWQIGSFLSGVFSGAGGAVSSGLSADR